jgi:hypothetical protein
VPTLPSPSDQATKILLIDGNNRYVRRARDGFEEVLAYVVSWEVAQRFMITIQIG